MASKDVVVVSGRLVLAARMAAIPIPADLFAAGFSVAGTVAFGTALT